MAQVDSDLRFDRQGHNFFGLYDLDWTEIPSLRPNVTDPSQNLNYLSHPLLPLAMVQRVFSVKSILTLRSPPIHLIAQNILSKSIL